MLRRRPGFTLIEMLVVIAIIAVLAAILFPVFSRVRENGRKTKCLANLQQISKAMDLYCSDYGGFIVNWCVSHPSAGSAPNPLNDPASHIVTWDISIGKYLKTQEVFKCGSNRNLARPDVGRNARAYCMTRYSQRIVGQVASGWETSWGHFKDNIPKPTETVLLFEKGDNPPGSWGDACGENIFESHNGPFIENYDPANVAPNGDYQGTDINVRTFHGKGKNLLFVDGHAKFYTIDSGPFAKTGVLPVGGTSVRGLVWTKENWPR